MATEHFGRRPRLSAPPPASDRGRRSRGARDRIVGVGLRVGARALAITHAMNVHGGRGSWFPGSVCRILQVQWPTGADPTTPSHPTVSWNLQAASSFSELRPHPRNRPTSSVRSIARLRTARPYLQADQLVERRVRTAHADHGRVRRQRRRKPDADQRLQVGHPTLVCIVTCRSSDGRSTANRPPG